MTSFIHRKRCCICANHAQAQAHPHSHSHSESQGLSRNPPLSSASTLASKKSEHERDMSDMGHGSRNHNNNNNRSFFFGFSSEGASAELEAESDCGLKGRSEARTGSFGQHCLCLRSLHVLGWQVFVVCFVFVLGVGVSIGLSVWIVEVNEEVRALEISNRFEGIVQVFDDIWVELFAGSQLLATYIQHAYYPTQPTQTQKQTETEKQALVSTAVGPSRSTFSELSKVLLSVLPVATFRYAMAFNESQKAAYVAETSAFYSAYFNTPNKTYWLSGVRNNKTRVKNYTSADGRYIVMNFIEPLAGNENSINADIMGKSGRPEWIKKIRDSGEGDVHEPFTPHRQRTIATSLFVPVKGRDDFILTLIRFKDVLAFASQEPLPNTDLLLFDTTRPLSATLVGSTAEEPPTINVSLTPEKHQMIEAAYSCLHVSRAIGTRRFELYLVVSKPPYPYSKLTAVLVGVVGSVSSCVLCLVLVLKFARHHEVAKAQMLHAKWEERAKVERAASNFIAHEVRNPLSVAITALKHIREDAFEGEGDNCHVTARNGHHNRNRNMNGNTEVELVEASLSYIDDLLRNVLDLNKIQRDHRFDLKLSVFSMREKVLCQVQKMLALASKEIQLNVLCNDPLWVETDRLRVQQVVMNLAKNACKFTQAGFIKLCAERKSPEVVVIRVEDSGPGIPRDKRKQLFQPYANVNAVQAQGSGIGLSICKLLVEAMHGTIRVDDKYDSKIDGCPGTRFVVELPLQDKSSSVQEDAAQRIPSANNPEHASSSTGDGSRSLGLSLSLSLSRSKLELEAVENKTVEMTQKRRLLVVDDEPLVRMITIRHLERCLPEGWEFEECSNGAEALRLSSEKDFDLFLIDQYMNHELTGVMTIRKLRQSGTHAVIIGYSANDVSQEHVQAGANEFWGKPLPSKPKLVQDIHRLLAQKSAARADSIAVIQA